MKIVSLIDAEDGDIVRCIVSRRGRRGWSFHSKTHLAIVDHRYGQNHLFVRPLCGSEAGRAEPGATFDDEQCQRCAKIATTSTVPPGD